MDYTQALRDYKPATTPLPQLTLDDDAVWDGSVTFLSVDSDHDRWLCHDRLVSTVGWMTKEDALLLMWAIGRVAPSGLICRLGVK